MRTVLSAEDLAFEEGYQAYASGTHRTDNPYPHGSKERNQWFLGWDRGLECNTNG